MEAPDRSRRVLVGVRSVRCRACRRRSPQRRVEAQRRLDLQHVLVVARRLHDDAELEQPVADRRRLLVAGSSVARSRTNSTPRYRPEAVHGADESDAASRELLEPAASGARRPRRAFSCRPSSRMTSSTVEPDHARDRAAARRREEVPLRPEPRGDLAVVITAPSGWPLPTALATATTSGTTPCCSKPQNQCAEPSVADLHLVGDRAGRRVPHRRVHRGEVAVGQRDAAGVAGERSRQMNAPAGGRPRPALDARGGLRRVARAHRPRGACRGRRSARPARAPSRAGSRARAGCRRPTWRPRRTRTSSRGTPRAARRRRGGRSRRSASRSARSTASEPLVHEEHGVERLGQQSPRAARRTRRPRA